MARKRDNKHDKFIIYFFHERKAKIDCFCFKTLIAMINNNLGSIVGSIATCQYPHTRETSVSITKAGSSKNDFFIKM